MQLSIAKRRDNYAVPRVKTKLRLFRNSSRASITYKYWVQILNYSADSLAMMTEIKMLLISDTFQHAQILYKQSKVWAGREGTKHT